MFDLIIKNGKVVDGTGKSAFDSDLGISKGKIKKIGKLSKYDSENVIDAEGMIVCPGFIDIQTHVDGYLTLFDNPTADSLIQQGVTSVIGGTCGSSLAPLVDPQSIKVVRRWADVESLNVNWLTIKEFLNEIESKGTSVNFGTYVGHTTIKRGILKDEVRELTNEEKAMAFEMADRALSEGALGLSTGLAYSHASFATTDEIIEFAKIALKHNKVYVTHLRNESLNLVEAVEEAIRIGEEAKVSVEISHFKARGKKSWPLFSKALQKIEEARSKEINVNVDVYPYCTTGSVLYTYLPSWITKGGRTGMLNRLKDPKMRQKLIREMKEDENDYAELTIAICPNISYVGKKVIDIASSSSIIAEEAILDILIANNGEAICFDHTVSDENLQKVILSDFSCVSSDGAGYSIGYKTTSNRVHPRCFGTFPKFIKEFVREKKAITLENAISKITEMPRKKLGIKDRGRIEKNMKADIVIFDLNKIKDLATFKNPYRYPEGIEAVVVNGKVVVRKGKHTKEMAGEIIRN